MSRTILRYDPLDGGETGGDAEQPGHTLERLVLDAAERLMAQKGDEAASVSALVDEAGVPASSRPLLRLQGGGPPRGDGARRGAVLRGAADPDRRQGSQSEHLAGLFETVAEALQGNPHFLRIMIVMATQPVNASGGEVHRVVNRVRDLALERLRDQMQIVFGVLAMVRTRPARALRSCLPRRSLRRSAVQPQGPPGRPGRAPACGPDSGAEGPRLIDLLENLNHADVGVAAPERQGASSPNGAKRVLSTMPGRS